MVFAAETDAGSYKADIIFGGITGTSFFSGLDFECFFDEKDNGDPFNSHNRTYPFIAPPTTIFGSLGLNSKHVISKGDVNNKIGSIEWMSSKSQNTMKDLWDLT